MNLGRLRLGLVDPQLFVIKVAGIAAAMTVLVPLVIYKQVVPAAAYLSLLLGLHLVFLGLYLVGIHWREIARNKWGLVLRISGVMTFAYLLTIIKFTGAVPVILANVALALVVHIAILMCLMASVDAAPGVTAGDLT